MATVSVCMIVKNEEAVLERCLNSLQGLAEELIIVDTGSTDHTRQIASRYTSQIYDYQWHDDFAAARNFSFSKATKDYIYCADADEVLDDTNRERFLRLKNALLPEIDIVQMYYCNQLQYNTVYNFDKEYRPKLYKRQRSFMFEDPIHERVRLEPIIFDSDIEIMHCPLSNHAGRDFLGFQKMIERDVRLSKRLHTMYAKELFIAGDAKDFLAAEPFFAQSVCDESRSVDEIREAACVLVHTARIRKDINAILKYALKDMVIEGSAEMCCELGEYFRENDDYLEASIWYYNAVYETEPILTEAYARIYAKEKLAECYERLGNAAQAAGLREELKKNERSKS